MRKKINMEMACTATVGQNGSYISVKQRSLLCWNPKMGRFGQERFEMAYSVTTEQRGSHISMEKLSGTYSNPKPGRFGRARGMAFTVTMG